MISIDQLVRSNILDMASYSSARHESSDKGDVYLDANENPYGQFNRYPDPFQRRLKLELSEQKGIDSEKLFLGNGSDEIIDLIIRIFCRPARDSILTFTPTYGMYRVLAEFNDVGVEEKALNENFQIDRGSIQSSLEDERIKVIFICSPNNPTCNTMDSETIDWICRSFNGIVVLDEAYIDFSTKPSWLERRRTYPNLIILQTLSKAYGMAGLRIGIAIANKSMISFLNKVKPPYNISSANQETALMMLERRSQILEQIERINLEKEKLRQEMQKLSIVRKIFPSDTNFLLIEMEHSDSVYHELKKQGIVVRNRNKEVKDCLRITIGSAEENDRLITVLKNIR